MRLRFPSRNRIAISAVVVALALAISLAGALFDRQRIREAGAGPAAVATETALGPFQLGEQVRNLASMKLRLELGDRGPPQTLEAVGEWIATPTDIHDNLAEVQCAWLNVEIKLDVSSGAQTSRTTGLEQQARELAAALAEPFFISYRADGTIANLWFLRSVNPAIANLQMTLAGTQQLVRGRSGESGWVAYERDVNGQYIAAYREVAAGRFEKQKARYMTTNALANAAVAHSPTTADAPWLQPAIQIEHSRVELRADQRGRLLEARVEESLAFELGTSGLKMKTAIEVDLRAGQTAWAPSAIGAFVRTRASLESRALEQMGGDPQALVAQRDRAVLGGATFEDLRVALGRVPVNLALDAEERRSLERRLEALFRLDGIAAARAPGLVREQPTARGKLVLDALSLVRTGASRAALAAIAGDVSVGTQLRGNAIRYLAHQEAPTRDVVTAMEALLDDSDPDLRQMARLTYGAFARSLRPTEPESAQRIATHLLTLLDRASAAEVRAELLVAIGNSGAPETLPTLQQIVASGGLRERALAIEALRFVKDPSVDTLLNEILGVSREPPIQLAAISTVRFRDAGPYTSALINVARTDSVSAVRQAALSVLGDRLSTLPTLRPVLEEIGNNDDAPRNRELATRYLAK